MLLHTERLSKSYGSFSALKDLDLTISPGEVFGLLGPNGSGKTTALRLVLGFLRPTSGRATIAGHDCWSDSVRARRYVSYLPGELRLYENMNGRQLVEFLERIRGHRADRDVDDLARRFEIDLSRPIADLSSGMKRKVALLQVLVPHASLLILDEPTNALDPTMRDELLAQIRLARDAGQAVVFSSHVLSEVEQVCDRVGILQKGRLVHLQEMRQLERGRLVRVRFGGPPPEPPTLPGLSVRERVNGQLILEQAGPLAPLLEWLGRQSVEDLRVEPLGLHAIYHRYHGAQA